VFDTPLICCVEANLYQIKSFFSGILILNVRLWMFVEKGLRVKQQPWRIVWHRSFIHNCKLLIPFQSMTMTMNTAN